MESKSLQENALLFLDLCSRIESLCAELYHFYSRVFSAHGDAARMWKKTALEEENHQKQLELALRLSNEIESLLPNGLAVAYAVYEKLYRLVIGVQNNPPDLVTALKKAIEMEERLAFLHIESSVTFKENSVQKMFLALRSADQEHVSAMKRQLAIESLAMAEMRG